MVCLSRSCTVLWRSCRVLVIFSIAIQSSISEGTPCKYFATCLTILSYKQFCVLATVLKDVLQEEASSVNFNTILSRFKYFDKHLFKLDSPNYGGLHFHSPQKHVHDFLYCNSKLLIGDPLDVICSKYKCSQKSNQNGASFLSNQFSQRIPYWSRINSNNFKVDTIQVLRDERTHYQRYSYSLISIHPRQ
jgi:hypothetical protein